MTDKAAQSPSFQAELVALIPHLRAFGRALSGDPVIGDDLVQDTLVKALANQHSYAMGSNMKAWAFMILRNQFLSNRRRDWRSVALDPEIAERTLVATEDPTGPYSLMSCGEPWRCYRMSNARV